MNAVACPVEIPLTGAKWAAKSEAYASLISEHLSADSIWLDAGCGCRLLEEDMDPLENWLVMHCKTIIGMDLAAISHRNITTLSQGSLYHLPFADNSLDLVTCRMVVEHLDNPPTAFAEIHRCLRPGGAIVVITPNLRNYGIFGNAMATKFLREDWRLKLVQSSDSRGKEHIFPVRYRANTMPRLVRLLKKSGLQVHRRIGLRQLRPYWKKAGSLEKIFMKLTPTYVLMVCAHKTTAKPLQRLKPELVPSYEGSTTEPVSAPDHAHLEPPRTSR
jgi:ubiquinone/menaquinone biosynthesis C-methylase UbiE